MGRRQWAEKFHGMPVAQLMYLLDNGSDEERSILTDIMNGFYTRFIDRLPAVEITRVIPFRANPKVAFSPTHKR